MSFSSSISNISIYRYYSYLVAIYALNLVNKASNCRNNSSLVLILKSADLIELCVLTYCMQCLDITIIACLTMLLKLDNVNNNAVERLVGLVGSRTSTNVFFHLTFDA
jgi:hypothetical protein